NLARTIPGKEEFGETLRWFQHRIVETGVQLRLSTDATPELLSGFDEVVLATGVVPRRVDFAGHDHPRVVGYLDVLHGRVVPGRRVAIGGAGGIGFDVAEFLVQAAPSPTLDGEEWMREWGVDPAFESAGGLRPPRVSPPQREVWLLQRSPGRPGARLGKTTGWIHRATLKHKGVRMIGGVEYVAVDDAGFHVRVDGHAQMWPPDSSPSSHSPLSVASPQRSDVREARVVSTSHASTASSIGDGKCLTSNARTRRRAYSSAKRAIHAAAAFRNDSDFAP